MSTSTKDHAGTTTGGGRQRIAIVGSGAVGCYYGARLWEAGHDVRFYMREPHATACTNNGLNVTSIDGDMYIPRDEINVYKTTESIGRVDWILVSLKSTSLDAIPDLIYPILHPDTRVLVIMNGLVEDDLIHMLKEKYDDHNNSSNDETIDMNAPLQCCRAMYGGMAFICCNRISPGLVDHSYAGLLTAGLASSRCNDPHSEQVAFEALWKTTESKIPITYEDNLLRGRWKKMLWNLPFNGISCSMGGITVDKIMTDPGLRELAKRIIDETCSVAHADLDSAYGKDGYTPLTEQEKTFMIDLSDTMGDYKPSTMLDLINRRPMEVKYLFEKPLERAKALGVAVPHLETVITQIKAYQRMYHLY